mmetsp:Transcript_93195/g.208607  ORF Transcript_93195/g.208607 Transcript_93195/m.208607 type:complete len:228 (-) Transcript_93195:570-1253(-)
MPCRWLLTFSTSSVDGGDSSNFPAAFQRRKQKPTHIVETPTMTAMRVGTKDHCFVCSSCVEAANPPMARTMTVEAITVCFAEEPLSTCAAIVGSPQKASITAMPGKWSSHQTPALFSSGVNMTIWYSCPEIGSAAGWPCLCSAMPSPIFCTISSVDRGYFVLIHHAKRATLPETRPQRIFTDHRTASGCHWGIPFTGGTCPQAFMMESGNAEAGMATTFGRKDLNMV